MAAASDMLKLPLTGSHLYYGDNLEIMRAHIPDESVDLIYLDPPFNSDANYNVLFRAPSGEQSPAQIQAFEDTWHWNANAEEAFDQVLSSGNTDAAEMIRAMRAFLGENDMLAYLVMMAVRMLEMHRVLKATGSIYLHCDPTASHYLKILLDSVFGARNYRSEIIWQRTPAHSSAKRYAPVHDVILYYQKSAARVWNEPRIGYEAAYLDKYYKFDDGDGRLHWRADITGAGVRTGDSGKPWRGHDPSKIHRHWAIPKEVIVDAVGADAAAAMSTQEKLDVLDGLGAIYIPSGDGMPQYKRYRSQLKGKALGDVWTVVDRINPVGSERLGYPTQKPVALLERIVAASSNPRGRGSRPVLRLRNVNPCCPEAGQEVDRDRRHAPCHQSDRKEAQGRFPSRHLHRAWHPERHGWRTGTGTRGQVSISVVGCVAGRSSPVRRQEKGGGWRHRRVHLFQARRQGHRAGHSIRQGRHERRRGHGEGLDHHRDAREGEDRSLHHAGAPDETDADRSCEGGLL